MNLWVSNIVRFLLVVLLQVLLINNLQFLGVCNPCIYLLFLLLLPTSLPRWAELLIGFLTGLLLDIFCNTLGAHAAACTAFSYVRPLLINNIVQEAERITGTPDVNAIGWSAFIRITSILVVLHHTILFFLLAFSMHLWWLTIIQIVVSSLLTIGLILGYQLLRTT